MERGRSISSILLISSLFLVTGSAFTGLLFTYVEVKWIPDKRRKIISELIESLDGVFIPDSRVVFTHHKNKFIAIVDFKFWVDLSGFSYYPIINIFIRKPNEHFLAERLRRRFKPEMIDETEHFQVLSITSPKIGSLKMLIDEKLV